jgi:3-oxoacyl-[acyl-carrier-protein] synthase II
MLGEHIYINGLGNISPQETIDNQKFLENTTSYSENYIKCIDPTNLRRMSHVIKMGVVSATFCHRDAGIKLPDGIITGTGLGCIEDTEKFLVNIMNSEDGMISPTSFIQSTHNTIAGQIALMLKCNAYNNTFVHRGFSFESALTDAIMLLNEKEHLNILVGGVDELTPNLFKILKQIGQWKKENISNLDLLKYKSKGTIAGEGSSFFMLGNKKTASTYGKIKAIKTFYQPTGSEAIENKLNDIVAEAKLNISDIDLVVFGLNGNAEDDAIYQNLAERALKGKNQAYFKHLCGEYHTASAFGLWLAAKILKTQTVPEVCRYNYTSDRTIKNILIYNHYFGINHAMYILSV